MKWLTNFHDPKDENFGFYVIARPDETHAQAVENTRRWLAGKIIGDPKATELCSVEQLKSWNMVGVYRA